MKYTDWRLPTRQELESILDLTRYSPSIDTRFFPDTHTSDYWSSTTLAYSPYYGAWLVDFYIGSGISCGKDGYGYIRAVRAGQDNWSLNDEPRFTDNGDGTITDNRTGLMWMKKTLGPCMWDKAHKLIEEMNKEGA